MVDIHKMQLVLNV